MERQKKSYFVYMVRCKNGTYYAGYTVDLENRLKTHNSGRGAKYLRGKTPVVLVYVKEYRDLGNAMRAERALKKIPRAKKEALVNAYSKKE